MFPGGYLSLSLATQHPRSSDPSSPMVVYKLKAIRPGKASPSIATTGTPVTFNASRKVVRLLFMRWGSLRKSLGMLYVAQQDVWKTKCS